MVDQSPEAAKNRGEQEATAKATATKTQRDRLAKQLADLQRRFGKDGEDVGELIVGTDEYNRLILFENVYGKDGQLLDRYERYFWIQPDGIDFKIMSASQVIKEIKLNYKNKLEVLRKQLYDKNFMDKTEFTTKDETALNQAILLAARNHSVTQAQSFTIEGKTKFTPFSKWITGLGTRPGDEADLPYRDINLQDRDVIEAIVKKVYQDTTGNMIDDTFLKQETDRYQQQIKEGTLTTTNKTGKERVVTTTKPFSQAQVEAELPKRIQKEDPRAMDAKKSYDFLAFIDNLGGQIL